MKIYEVLEKRDMSDINTVVLSLRLQEKVDSQSFVKNLILSNDGTICVVAGGYQEPFYVIDLQNETQYKFNSQSFGASYSPCFINGDPQDNAVGGRYGEGVQIWNIKKQQVLRTLDIDSGYVGCTTSTNNILAVGSSTGLLQLWDVRCWENVYSSKLDGCEPISIHLTSDAQYITIGSYRRGDAKCIVLRVK